MKLNVINVTSGYGGNTRQPFVEIKAKQIKEPMQLLPEEARDLALNLLQAAVEHVIRKKTQMNNKPITTIRITREAIDYLARIAGLDNEDAEELLTALFSMCAISSEPGGGGEEDRLFKTADALMDYYANAGASAFRSRFGSLDILDACRQIIREGEGNPHPWPEE